MSCFFCGRDEPRMLNTAQWDTAGSRWLPERIEVCSSTSCRESICGAPRRPRKPKSSRIPATDYNMLSLFINGKKASRRRG